MYISSRSAGEKFGFAASIISRKVTANSVPESEIDMEAVKEQAEAMSIKTESEQSDMEEGEEDLYPWLFKKRMV